MSVNQYHEVVPCQIQLECLTCSVVKGNNPDKFKWQITLQKVYREVLVCYHTWLSVNDSEFFNRVLGDLISILDRSTHVQRDVHWANLIEKCEVLTDLLAKLVFKRNYAKLVEWNLELICVLACHWVISLLVVDLEWLEVCAGDLEANFDEVVESLRWLDHHVVELVGRGLDFWDYLSLDLFLLNYGTSLLFLLSLKTGLEHVSVLSMCLELMLFLD